MADIAQPDHNDVVAFAAAIGNILVRHYPAPDLEHGSIPADNAEAISDYITLVVAEILQAWLDAGSEREVTLEELFGPIYDHVKGWVVV
jgi:hypothetical protein